MSRIMRSAAYRIALLYALGFTTVTLVLGLVIVLVSHVALTRQLEGQILEEARALHAEYRLEGFREFTFAIRERQHVSDINEMRYAVFGSNGQRLVGDLDAMRPAPGWSDVVFHDPQEGSDLARAWAVDIGQGLRLVVAADKSVIDRVDQQLILIMLIAFAVLLLLSLAGALFLGAYLRRRLSAMSDAADQIMAGDITQRVPTSGTGDEFDALALSLNRMLNRITGLVDNLRQVSSDIAHDLRTPLARLRTHLEDSLENGTEASRQERLEVAIVQADKLLSLFNGILRISEVEAGRRRASFRSFDLDALVLDIVDSYVPLVEEGGRSLTSSIASGAHVQGDPELLSQALINLLDNALIHTPTGTAIHVDLHTAADQAVITISDDGPGVSPDAQEAIFRRFVRLDPARGPAGHGLGLNLVSAITALHGGVVQANDNGPGLRVTIQLPMKAPDSAPIR